MSLPVIATIVLLVIKLTGAYDPSWFVVFLPLIITVGLAILFSIIALVFGLSFAFLARPGAEYRRLQNRR